MIITCHRSHFEERCRQRGYSFSSVLGCVVSVAGDIWAVDTDHVDYPVERVGALGFKCVPDCNSPEFACSPGFCCEENPIDGTNSCLPCSSSTSGSSASSCVPTDCYYCAYDYWSPDNYGQVGDPGMCPGGSVAVGPFGGLWNCRKFAGPFAPELGQQMMMDPSVMVQNCPMDDPDYLMPAVFTGTCCGGSCSPVSCVSSSSSLAYSSSSSSFDLNGSSSSSSVGAGSSSSSVSVSSSSSVVSCPGEGSGSWQLVLCDEEDCGYPACSQSPSDGWGPVFSTREQCMDCHSLRATCNFDHPKCWQNL